MGCVSVEAFEIFGQEGDLESCGGLSWEDLLEKPEDLSDCEPDSCAPVRVVLDVTDVLVSGIRGTTVLFFPPKRVHLVVQVPKKR